MEPLLTRKGLPGDPDDAQSRYIEAAIKGMVIGCLYPPKGIPIQARNSTTSSRGSNDSAPTLRNFSIDVPVILAGDYNVMPMELDVYKPERWVDDALFPVEVRQAYKELVGQGWTDAVREPHPAREPTRSGDTSGTPSAGTLA